MTPLVLNIETATDICSIGLSKGQELLAKTESEAPYKHASQITLLIKSCCDQVGCHPREVDAVAISRGPGSYTSLRVGTSVAKGICYSLDKPLIAVDTLKAIALASQRETDGGDFWYCPMIDARRMEVYAALYDARNAQLEPARPHLIDEDSFQKYFAQRQDIVFSGNGSAKCRPLIRHECAHFREVNCDAAHLVPLSYEAYQRGAFEDVAYYAPNYLKPPNITKPKRVL